MSEVVGERQWRQYSPIDLPNPPISGHHNVGEPGLAAHGAVLPVVASSTTQKRHPIVVTPNMHQCAMAAPLQGPREIIFGGNDWPQGIELIRAFDRFAPRDANAVPVTGTTLRNHEVVKATELIKVGALDQTHVAAGSDDLSITLKLKFAVESLQGDAFEGRTVRAVIPHHIEPPHLSRSIVKNRWIKTRCVNENGVAPRSAKILGGRNEVMAILEVPVESSDDGIGEIKSTFAVTETGCPNAAGIWHACQVEQAPFVERAGKQFPVNEVI